MKKRIIYICMTVILAAFCCLSMGCGSLKNTQTKSENVQNKSEEEIFNDAVDDFFKAVDDKDKDAILKMFAPSVRAKDKTLEKDIEQLLNNYPGPTDICKRDGRGVAGSYDISHGKKSAEVTQGFPVVSNDTYYWCDFTFMYQNDMDEKQIGIKQVKLSSAEYECEERYNYVKESRKGTEKGRDDDSEEKALEVLTDCIVDYEVRFVGGYPEKFNPIDRDLSKEQVEEFFKTSYSYSEFLKEFGDPNVD
nr:DUF5104 domain-containing protein [Lachnospiraceae bacterium]